MDGTANSKDILRSVIESLPFDSEQVDAEQWKAAMDGSEFAEKLVRIPYNTPNYRDEIVELSDDIYFGRIPYFFNKPSNWNKTMIELIEGMGIKNQISIKNKDFELEKFSVFDDIYDGHEKRTNIRSFIYDNLRDSEWRRTLIDSTLLSSQEEKILQKLSDETSGIIPHLSLRETVHLVDQTYNFLDRTQRMIYDIYNRNIEQLNQIQDVKNKVPSISQMQDAVYLGKKMVGYRDRRRIDRDFRNFKQEMKNMGTDQSRMVKEIQLAKDAFENISESRNRNTFLINFVEFFHEKLQNGDMRIKKQKRWGNLFNDFLKFQFPHTFSLFKGKGLDGGNPFSLTASSWVSNQNAQKSLITLLQSFGQPNREPALLIVDEKTFVKRMDCEQIADQHLAALEKMIPIISDMGDWNE